MQVGWVELQLIRLDGTSPDPLGLPVFNLEPQNGQAPPEIGFAVPGAVNALLQIEVRSDGDYGLSVVHAGISRIFFVKALALTIWGVPGDPSHDPQRLDMKTQEPVDPGPLPRIPFYTNPTSCGAQLPLHASATSYQQPAKVVKATATLPPITGCEEVGFAPTLRARPSTDVADSPSGLDLDLQIPQNLDPGGLASAQLREAKLTLPEGLVVNPSAANGLGACSPEQIGLRSAVGERLAHFDTKPPSCPDASGIGTVEVQTPLIAAALQGTVYLATPHRNPSGSLLAVYLAIRGPGLEIKLPGELEADPATGRLTVTFEESPQLPIEHLRLHLFRGPLAPLRTPELCGTYATTSTLTPWSAPQSGPPAAPKDEYAIKRAPGGDSCARSAVEVPLPLLRSRLHRADRRGLPALPCQPQPRGRDPAARHPHRDPAPGAFGPARRHRELHRSGLGPGRRALGQGRGGLALLPGRQQGGEGVRQRRSRSRALPGHRQRLPSRPL